MTRGRAISLIVALVLANLGGWAWQAWYAPPARGSVPWRAPGAADARPAPAMSGVATVHLAGEGGAAPPIVAAGADADAVPPAGDPAAAQPRCQEIGPFTALAASAMADAALRQRGYAPRSVYAGGVTPLRYLVRIDGLPTAADQGRVLARLRAAGLGDMAALPAERAVSVGIFSESGRAAMRMQQVQAVGFTPRVEPRYPADAEHWLRVDLAAPLPPGLTPARALAGPWRVRPCTAPP